MTLNRTKKPYEEYVGEFQSRAARQCAVDAFLVDRGNTRWHILYHTDGRDRKVFIVHVVIAA